MKVFNVECMIVLIWGLVWFGFVCDFGCSFFLMVIRFLVLLLCIVLMFMLRVLVMLLLERFGVVNLRMSILC